MSKIIRKNVKEVLNGKKYWSRRLNLVYFQEAGDEGQQ